MLGNVGLGVLFGFVQACSGRGRGERKEIDLSRVCASGPHVDARARIDLEKERGGCTRATGCAHHASLTGEPDYLLFG